MKKLTRVKLINWHRFYDTTIEFGESTLVSGENGAGKSTLLDAIQFVVTCTANHFNKAAHENGKRKLTGYIRCKTGRENKPYERTGEISAHIALEFYEESRDEYFVVGAVIDSASEGQETVVRYLMDKTRFTDDMFVQGNTPRNITAFRTYNKRIKHWAKTQTEAKKFMKARFGRIEDKFFTLIPKAMAFKPINDIKDFVYSYVLDEKEVNIDILRENVRSYQDLEQTLKGVKARLIKLEEIQKKFEEVMNGVKRDQQYEYYLGQAELDILEQKQKEMQAYISKEKYDMEDLKRQLKQLEVERSNKQNLENTLRVELSQNQEFLALEAQKEKLEGLLSKKQSQREEKRELLENAKKAFEDTVKLLEVKDVDCCVSEYSEMLERLGQWEDVTEAKERTDRIIHYKKEMYEKVQARKARLELDVREGQEKAEELRQMIKKLEQKQFTYPSAVNQLLAGIRQEFIKLGRESDPRVLCELLEITDASWKNAVEGYLHTQRFYLLVEPENFDIALGMYHKLRKQKSLYGVGLINAGKLEQYDAAPKDSLAAVVTSKSLWAKRYVNMILGKVHCCERYEDLKKYSTAITKTCMRYQNNVASAIKPEIYETPYIGVEAFHIQLEQSKHSLEALRSLLAEQTHRLDSIKAVLQPLGTEQDVAVKFGLDILSKLQLTENAIVLCDEEIEKIKKNSTIIEKQIRMEELEVERKKLDVEMNNGNRHLGNSEEKIRTAKEQQKNLDSSKKNQSIIVEEILCRAQENSQVWVQDYRKLSEQRSLIQLKENYSRQQKTNETNRNNAEKAMKEEMVNYKMSYDFGAPPTLEGYPEFMGVYNRLKNSELLSYEEKVQKARTAAEEEFREQFLSKLQENMKQAQSEFKELNKALKDIPFSNEMYEFLYLPSKKYEKYYRMIMDDFNVMQGESIFTGLFHETHKDVIDELFERLALDTENAVKTLDEFTDYRTYMDYDIRIIHSDGNYSLYSKVCEEKSGGETQTPFYVTVAASFVQLYRNNIGGEAIGLVMFDEAFNNMDDERIGGVLEFLNRLPLQLIIAAPPDKIQYIGPSMERTLLVLTDEKVSFVEEYYNGKLRKENTK